MTEAAEPVLLTSLEDGVFTITLNRPRQRNALNRALLARYNEALDEALENPEIGAIVLTGNGPAFCAGFDMKEGMGSAPPPDFWTRYLNTTRGDNVYGRLPKLPKPVIAAVNGFAVGAGCALAISADAVFAADTAKLGYPEVGHGIVASLVSVSLARTVGRLTAMDLLLSGRMLDAAEARELRMVTRVVPAGDLLAEATAYAKDLAAKSPVAVRLTKELFRQVPFLDDDRALAYVGGIGLLAREGSFRPPSA